MWFKADEFARFCHGEIATDILTFGIGDADEGEFKYLSPSWKTEYIREKRWLVVSVGNEMFEAAKTQTGGEMLWEIATIVAKMSKKFTDALTRLA